MTTERRRPSLSGEQMNSLAAGLGDAAAIAALRQGQIDKVLLSLALIIETVPEDVIGDAVSLLGMAQRASIDAYEEVLAYPMTGAWASACVARIGGVETEESVETLARHLASIAAVAAWRGGLHEFCITVPVTNGFVVLPGLGRARVAPGDRSAVVSCRHNVLTISSEGHTIDAQNPDADGDGWEAIRHVSLPFRDRHWKLAIDDIDPFRGRDLLSPEVGVAERLDGVAFRTFERRSSMAGLFSANAIRTTQLALQRLFE